MHREYLEKLWEALRAVQISREGQALPQDYEEAMHGIVRLFEETKRNKNQAFFIGNGGSAAIASHMTADFMKNGGIRTCSLYDASVLTCMGNDFGYAQVFSQPLEQLAKPGDLLVAVSSSGNSENIVHAIGTAREKGMNAVTFSAFAPENRIRGLGMWNVYVPVSHYGMAESAHQVILQQIVDALM